MKLRIGFVVPSLLNGGAERVVATLANYFSNKHEVTIIVLRETDVFYEINSSVKLRFLRDIPHRSFNYSGIFRNYTNIVKLKKVIKEEKIELLISFTTSANVLSTIASKRSKIPCIVSERNNAKVVPPKFFWRILRNVTYKLSDFLVVQTKGNKNFYSSIMDSNKIKVIQNPISKNISSLTIETKKNNAKINILTVGRLNKNKAHHIGLKALSQLKNYDWELSVVGGGPLESELKALSKNFDIQNRLTFTGSIKNVEEYYKKADIFIFTSRSEGFPNALTEAHYLGIPCISTNCDFGPSDIIRDNVDGYLIPVNDVQALKEKLIQLFEDENLRTTFSNNAKELSSRFNMKKIASQWENLIHRTTNI